MESVFRLYTMCVSETRYSKGADIMGQHNCYGRNEHECIQKKAYELWEKDGHRHGHALDHWLLAEQHVKGTVKKEQREKVHN